MDEEKIPTCSNSALGNQCTSTAKVKLRSYCPNIYTVPKPRVPSLRILDSGSQASLSNSALVLLGQ